MTILVTGGAGFIGSNFVFYMLSEHKDIHIVCLDKLTYAGNLTTLRPILDPSDIAYSQEKASRFHFCMVDLCDREMVDAVFEQYSPEAVVHFAAESHVDRSIEDPGIFLQTNIIGTGILMDACRKYGNIRFHQISTDEVYGDLPLDRPDMLFTEASPIRPSSPYSASKAAADLLVLSYFRTYKLPVTISRCGNNYGPFQFPEKLIPRMIVSALQDRPLPVYGKGENVRDWIHTKDHCRAIDLILQKGRSGQIFNIGSSQEMRNIDLVRMICRLLGKPESLISYVEDRKGHDLRYALDASKIQNELGWHPETDFYIGLEKTVSWYIDNRSWWEDIMCGEYRAYYTKLYGDIG